MFAMQDHMTAEGKLPLQDGEGLKTLG